MGNARSRLEAFRVSAREHLELGLLAKARGTTKSELLRALVREAAERETGTTNNRTSGAQPRNTAAHHLGDGPDPPPATGRPSNRRS